MKKLETKGIEIYSWCPDIEQSALDQMIHLATLPFVKHCALMPDAHLGQNMPIGGVIGCDNVVIPDSVGADIGCGMCAMLTSLTTEDIESEEVRKKLHHSFSRSIPVGFQHNSEKRIIELGNRYAHEIDELESKSITGQSYNPINNIRKDIASQLGTLGGG